jgi:hypothetical protein
MSDLCLDNVTSLTFRSDKNQLHQTAYLTSSIWHKSVTSNSLLDQQHMTKIEQLIKNFGGQQFISSHNSVFLSFFLSMHINSWFISLTSLFIWLCCFLFSSCLHKKMLLIQNKLDKIILYLPFFNWENSLLRGYLIFLWIFCCSFPLQNFFFLILVLWH